MGKPEDVDEGLFGLQSLGFTLGLDRVRAMLAALGDPQRSFEVVLVGGTNGKGSCALALASCLQAGGTAAALFTSPHLSRLTERFRVDGVEVDRAQLEAVLALVRPLAVDVQASFFEVLTVCACVLFANMRVHTAVMEVGLGGRFDATNALEPRLSVITGIALDHTALLGEDEVAIAREKAGIMRRDRLLLTGATGEALQALKGEASRLGTPVWTLGEELTVAATDLGWDGLELEVNCPAGRAGGRSPLVGSHQARNLALAVGAALALGVEGEAVTRGLAAARWPGRLERFAHEGRHVVFDGAHNPSAAEELSATLEALGERDYVLVVGVGRDKDLAGVAGPLGWGAGQVIATQAQLNPRARPAAEVAAAFGPDARAIESPHEALRAALEATPEGGTLLVAGSLYLVGELRPLVSGEASERFERFQ